MKKAIWICLAIVVLIILLFPIRLQYKDGGSVSYQSIAGIYRVTDWHQMLPTEEGEPMKYKEGLSIEIFGREIYNNMLSIPAG